VGLRRPFVVGFAARDDAAVYLRVAVLVVPFMVSSLRLLPNPPWRAAGIEPAGPLPARADTSTARVAATDHGRPPPQKCEARSAGGPRDLLLAGTPFSSHAWRSGSTERPLPDAALLATAPKSFAFHSVSARRVLATSWPLLALRRTRFRIP